MFYLRIRRLVGGGGGSGAGRAKREAERSGKGRKNLLSLSLLGRPDTQAIVSGGQTDRHIYLEWYTIYSTLNISK